MNAIIHAGKLYIFDQLIGIIKKDVKGGIESHVHSFDSLRNHILCHR